MCANVSCFLCFRLEINDIKSVCENFAIIVSFYVYTFFFVFADKRQHKIYDYKTPYMRTFQFVTKHALSNNIAIA